jgi:hypothetical protein
MVSFFIVAASMKKDDEAAVVRCYPQKLSDLPYENFIYTDIFTTAETSLHCSCVSHRCVSILLFNVSDLFALDVTMCRKSRSHHPIIIIPFSFFFLFFRKKILQAYSPCLIPQLRSQGTRDKLHPSSSAGTTTSLSPSWPLCQTGSPSITSPSLPNMSRLSS